MERNLGFFIKDTFIYKFLSLICLPMHVYRIDWQTCIHTHIYAPDSIANVHTVYPIHAHKHSHT